MLVLACKESAVLLIEQRGSGSGTWNKQQRTHRGWQFSKAHPIQKTRLKNWAVLFLLLLKLLERLTGYIMNIFFCTRQACP
jgi:hypothetical protein